MVEENLKNKDLKNAKENLFYAEATNELTPILTEDVLDPELTSMAVLDTLAQEPKKAIEIQEAYRKKAEELLRSMKLLWTTGLGPRLTDESLVRILDNPSRGFLEVLRILEAKEKLNPLPKQNIDPLVNFNKNYDIVDFNTALGNYVGNATKEELASLVKLQAQLTALQHIQLAAEGGFNHVEFLSKIRKFIKNNPLLPLPSSAQIRVARELATFFSTPKNSGKLYSAGAALRAPAGAGKSLVVSKLLKYVLGLKDEEIISAAPYQLAAENIAESLGNPDNTNTIEQIIAKLESDTLGKVRTIIIDEAGGLTIETINKFASAVAKYNTLNEEAQVKYLFLYDPNQVTPGNVGRPALDLEFYDNFSATETEYHNGDKAVKEAFETGRRPITAVTGLPLVENLLQISPLSATYRADLDELIDLQNQYKSKEEVVEHNSSSSKDISLSAEEIEGSFAETGNSIVDSYKRSVRSNPARTRIILVGSKAKQAQYQASLPDATVLMVPEAAGIVRDEVYVDITRGDQVNFENVEVYNQWVYTALSRARKYAHLSNVPKASHIVDPTIAAQPKTTRTAEEVLKLLEERIKILEALTDVAVPSEEAPVPESKTKKEKEEEEEDITWEEDIPIDTPPQQPVVQGAHRLLHPTNATFKHDQGRDGINPLVPGETLHIALDNTPKKDGTPASRYVILRKLGGGLFERIAVLGESENRRLEENLGISLQTLQPSTLSSTATPGVFRSPGLDSIEIINQASSAPLQYLYGEEPTEDFSSLTRDANSGKITDIPLLRKYLNEMWGPSGDEQLENYSEILANPAKHVTIGVFKSAKDLDRWFPDATSIEDRPQIGPPYMMIHGLRTTTGKVVKTQFIRLAPTVLNTKTTNIEPLVKFIKTLEQFEKALASSKLPGAYSTLKLGGMVDIAGEKYFPFHELITHLSNTHTALVEGKEATLKLSPAPALNKLFPDVDGKKIPKKLLELASELDFLVHGNIEAGKRRSYKGEAQLIMDSIGSQNLVITTHNGKNIILRDYKVLDEEKDVKDTKGISLLGPIKFTRKKGLAYNPKINSALLNRLEAYRGSLVRRGKAGTPRFHFINELLETPGNKHLSPISLEDLKDVFLEGQDKTGTFSNISEGFGLRTPLPKSFDVSAETALENLPLELVTTHFTGVRHTVIDVALEAGVTSPLEQEQRRIERSALIQLKRKIENFPKKTSAKTIEQALLAEYPSPSVILNSFISSMKASSLEKAIEDYLEAQKQSQLYITQNVAIITALKDVARQESTALDNIKVDIETSLDVKDTGRNQGDVASRDFIRASVLTRILNAINEQEVFTIADFARTDYYSGKKFDRAKFDNDLESLIYEFESDEAIVRQKLQEVINHYNTLAQQAGLTERITYTELEDLYDIFDQLIPISSALRKKAREGSAIPTVQAFDAESLDVPTGFSNYLEKLMALSDSPAEEFEDVFQSNFEYRDKVLSINPDDPMEGVTKLLEAIHSERSKRFLGENLGEEFSDIDVDNYVSRFTGKTPVQFLKSLFSNKKGELYQILKYGQLINARGETVWGLYKNGITSFARLANGKISSRVVRHELFHKVFWEYLTPAEQVQALNLAREVYGELGVVELEEKLAESFETFVKTKTPNIFEILWNKLKRLLGFTYNNLSSIENFFNLIDNKAFYFKQRETPLVERAAMNLRSEFNSYTEYHQAKTFILAAYSEIQRNRPTTRVLSQSEILEAVVERMKDFVESPSKSSAGITYTQEEAAQLRATLAKILKNGGLWRKLVNHYFGQTQTRGAVLKVLDAIKLKDIEEKEAKLAALLEGTLAEVEEGNEENVDTPESLTSELDALRAETFDSMLVDPHVKLTGAIKQRLITIKYWKNGKEDYADLNRAYSFLLERIASIPKHSIRGALEALKHNFKEFQGIRSKPNIRWATGNAMLNLFHDIETKLDAPSRLKNISFRKDATFKGVYAIYSLDGSSVEEVTLHTAKQFPTKYGVEHQQSTTHSFIELLANRVRVPYSSVGQAYYLFEDVDFLKSLLAAVASLRKSKPLAFIERWDYGIYKVINYIIKAGGGKRAHEANLRFFFDKYVETRLEAKEKKLFPQEFMDKLYNTNVKTIEEKRSLIKEFLNLIDVHKRITDASARSVELFFERLKLVAPKLQAGYATEKTDYETEEEYQEARSGETLLENEGSFIDELTDMLNSHFALGETHSYTRGDGKKAFGWIDSSYQTDLLTSLENALQGRPAKNFDTFSVQNGKVRSTDPFLSSNIFFNGLNTLFSFNEHDSWKQKGNERFAKFIRKENLVDFRKRHIVGNFISRIAASRGKYYQALPIPSNRTTIANVEVSVLKGAQIDKALTAIINAQKNRPDPKLLGNNPTYAKNYQSWRFAGLTGSTKDLSTTEAIETIKKHVAAKVAELLPTFIRLPEKNAKVPISDKDLKAAASVLNIGIAPEWKRNMTDEELNNYFEKRNQIVEKLLESFYFNFIINQYSLSQIIYGDEAFFANKEEQTKRIQIVTATGDTMLIDAVHGLPKESKVLVVEDLVREIPEDLEAAINASYGADYEASDAEGFMLPEFYEKIASAYGADALVDTVLKPVYFSIEKGVPTAVKYSVKVLTDELVSAFPHLATYREAMRNAKADQMVFKSGVKIGRPARPAKLGEDGRIHTNSISEGSFITLNNENLRFQLNPAHSVETSVAAPSQATAMQDTNGENTHEIYDLHLASATIIDNGVRQVSRDLRLTSKGTLTAASENLLRAKLIENLDGLDGAKDVYEILKTESKKQKASFNLPLIADRVVSSIGSMITAATTGFRFKGSKLVLQADLGPVEITNPDGSKEMRNLKWRDSEGYCEVILPEEYAAYMTVGDILGLSNGLVGFRIPTTNYHSLLPMKVVGFYPKSAASQGNIIIAPSLIVYYHGSDYDVDSLFVIRKDYNDMKEPLDLNIILSSVDPSHDYNPDLVTPIGEAYGYRNGKPITIEGAKLRDYLTSKVISISQQINLLTSQMAGATYAERSQLNARLKDLNDKLSKLNATTETVAKNDIVHNFATNLLEMKNRKDLLTPISFEDVVRNRHRMQKELSNLLTDDINSSFYKKLAESGLIKIKC